MPLPYSTIPTVWLRPYSTIPVVRPLPSFFITDTETPHLLPLLPEHGPLARGPVTEAAGPKCHPGSARPHRAPPPLTRPEPPLPILPGNTPHRPPVNPQPRLIHSNMNDMPPLTPPCSTAVPHLPRLPPTASSISPPTSAHPLDPIAPPLDPFPVPSTASPIPSTASSIPAIPSLFPSIPSSFPSTLPRSLDPFPVPWTHRPIPSTPSLFPSTPSPSSRSHPHGLHSFRYALHSP